VEVDDDEGFDVDEEEEENNPDDRLPGVPLASAVVALVVEVDEAGEATI
jgi:hypothetical protein